MAVETDLQTTLDLDLALSAGSAFTFAGGTLGSVAGNRLAIASSTSGFYIRDMQWADGDGLRLRTVPFGLKESATDDEISFAFT
jgi:hypothetical protein